MRVGIATVAERGKMTLKEFLDEVNSVYYTIATIDEFLTVLRINNVPYHYSCSPNDGDIVLILFDDETKIMKFKLFCASNYVTDYQIISSIDQKSLEKKISELHEEIFIINMLMEQRNDTQRI